MAQKGNDVLDKIRNAKDIKTLQVASITTAHLPISFGPSQMRVSADWQVRDWAFSEVVGGLHGELTYARIGDLIFIGTPCDFSGEIFAREELEAFAHHFGKELIITSFNGNYVGYITDDLHYDVIERDEVRIMNWVGPYYGKYFTDMIRKLLEKNP